MIRFIYDHKSLETVASASGNAPDIASELGYLVSIAYNLIRSRSPEMAEVFRRSIIAVLAPESPVWDKENIPDPPMGIKEVRIKDYKEENLHG